MPSSGATKHFSMIRDRALTLKQKFLQRHPPTMQEENEDGSVD